MTTPAANVSAVILPVAAEVPGTGRASATTVQEAGPFQAALAAASLPLATDPVGIVGVDELAPLDESDDPTDSELAGLLAVAAQVLAPPVNAAVAQANGLTPPADAPVAASGEPTRTRSDALLLDRSAADTVPQPTAPPTQAPATQPQLTAAPTDVPLPDSVPTPAVVVARSTTVAAARGQTPAIPAQPPIVVNLIPNVPVPVDPSVTNPPVAEPTAAIPASALPSAQLGQRPANAGEPFAALASAGAQLAAPAQPPASVAFTNVLTEADRTGPAPTVALPVEPAPRELPPQESVPAARVRFATGETVLPPVNFSRQALTALASTPVRFVEVVTEARPTEKAVEDVTSAAPNALAGADRFAPTAPPAPAPAEAVRVAPAAPAVQLAESVVVHAQVLKRDGEVEFQMRLDPPELGRMQVRLVTRGDEIHGQVVVASDAVRGMIESQLPELRHRLEAAGVTIERFDVATDPNTGGGRNPYREAEPTFAPRAPEARIAPRPRAAVTSPGTLDVTV